MIHLTNHPPSYHIGTLRPIEDVAFWHKRLAPRLAHIHFQRLHHMAHTKIVDGIPDLPHLKVSCSVCIQAKQTRRKIPKGLAYCSTSPFELPHSKYGVLPKFLL